MTQLGGPDGEAGAATRYLSQRYTSPYDEVSAVLTDIGVSVPKLHLGITIQSPFAIRFATCSCCFSPKKFSKIPSFMQA
jgi:hypothetical protein